MIFATFGESTTLLRITGLLSSCLQLHTQSESSLPSVSQLLFVDTYRSYSADNSLPERGQRSAQLRLLMPHETQISFISLKHKKLGFFLSTTFKR